MKAVKYWVWGFVALTIVLILIYGKTPPEAPEQALESPEQASQCPRQGVLQSDWSYCMDLCMIGKANQDNTRSCEQVCDMGERIGKLRDKIQQYKCSKCGEGCTPEQLAQLNETQ